MRSQYWLTPERACDLLTPRRYRAVIARIAAGCCRARLRQRHAGRPSVFCSRSASRSGPHDLWLPAVTARIAAVLLLLGDGDRSHAGDRVHVHHAPGWRRDFPRRRLGDHEPAPAAGGRQGARGGAEDHLRLRARMRQGLGARLRAPGHEPFRRGDARRRRSGRAARAVRAPARGRETAAGVRADVRGRVSGRAGRAAVPRSSGSRAGGCGWRRGSRRCAARPGR